MDKKIKTLVTGGAGFIGSHVVDLLLDHGHSVIVLDNFSTGRIENLSHVADKIDIVECDISKPGEWASHFNNIDWVIHLAALADIVPSIQNPGSYFQANVVGTFNVLQAAKSNNVQFESSRAFSRNSIFCSKSAFYLSNSDSDEIYCLCTSFFISSA